MFTLSLTDARRLAITRQHLADAHVQCDADGIYNLVRELGCLQLDPISAVARSHLLVLWSRLGSYDRADLDVLLWEEKKLFEYWAHAASIVLTEDYPIHNLMMRTYPNGGSAWHKIIRDWMAKNQALKRHILHRLRREGPLLSRDLEIEGQHPNSWASTGWTSGRDVSMMLDRLWIAGRIMVVGRVGGQKLWDLTERFLPAWTPREKLSEREIVYRAAQKSLRALGVATPKQIAWHYIRNRYPDLKPTLSQLEREEKIIRAQIENVPGEWYIHADDLARVEKIRAGEFEPRTTLLSPFDNLINDRNRTRQLYDFDYTIEIYTPAPKRKFGYYVMPILHGDALIGRIDPLMDRERGVLNINAVYAERAAPRTRAAARAIRNAIENLASFLGAREIVYSKRVPPQWKKDLK